MVSALVMFVCLLPLFILLRTDSKNGWTWAVVLLPLWLADAFYVSFFGFGLCVALRRGDQAQPFTIKPVLVSTGVFACVLASQILLTGRLSSTADLSPVSFTVAVAPLFVALLPIAFGAAATIAIGLCRHFRPSVRVDAPPSQSCAQLTRPVLSLVGWVLVCVTLALAGLVGDGRLHISWWVVLAPTWLQAVVLWARWGLALRAVIAADAPTESDEDRSAKVGALVIAAVGGGLFTTCLLLLSLRIGGLATYDAYVIGMPIIGTASFVTCCCGCLGVCARTMSHTQHATCGPPYEEVVDEEAVPPATAEDMIVDGHSRGGSSGGGSCDGIGGEGSGGGGDGGGDGDAAPVHLSPLASATRMAEAVDFGQQIVQ